MDEIILEILMPVVILSIIILFFFIARSNAKIDCLEKGEVYKGFITNVLLHLFQTGGNSFLFNPFPVFLFDDIDEKIKRELIKKNYYILIIVLLIAASFLFYFITTNGGAK